MKKVVFVLLGVFILFSACSKEEKKLELFSPEAFCYSLDPGWELNATVNVKNFKQEEKDNSYSAKISFTTDLTLPDKTIKKNLFSDKVEKSNNEVILDIPLECQLELDSTYSVGDYQITFNVKDELTGNTTSITKAFKVEK